MRSDSDLSAVRWHAGAFNNGLIFGATCYGVTHLPRACSYALGDLTTWLTYHLMRNGTRALVDNLRIVRPTADQSELNRLALLTYRSYARDTIDFIRSLEMTRDQLAPMMVRLDSRAFDTVLAQGRGGILVGGHFGNWELGGVALRLLRNYPVTVVGRSEPSAMVGLLRRRMRDSLGIDTLEIGHMLDTALQIRRLLTANRFVATLLDRHLGRDRVDVTFFGRRTGFLRSPAMMAYLSGAPLLPSFMLRQSDGRFLGWGGEPILVDTSLPPEDGIRAATQEFADQLERQILANPHLWYQFYAYWPAQEPTAPYTRRSKP